MYLASKFEDKNIIILSNIKKIYTADPKINPDAKPIDSMTWEELHSLVGDDWVPGNNVPMDPKAVKEGLKQKVKIIFADGKDLNNFKKILDDGDFEGTIVQ
jgi:uridylate kinase